MTNERKERLPELFYHDPSELGEDAFKQFRWPPRETIAVALWNASGHWTTEQWTVSRLQETAAWDDYLKQADAMLALFACVCGVGDHNPCPDCPSACEP